MKDTPWEAREQAMRKSAKWCGAVMMLFSPICMGFALANDDNTRAVGLAALAVGLFLAGLYQWRRRWYLLDFRHWKKSS